MTEFLRWRRSSRSASGSECVELAHNLEAVRDSKNPATVLAAPARALLEAAKCWEVR